MFAPLEDTRRAAGLGDAGGIIGAIGAGPLSKVVSPYGAFVIDAGLAAIGLLIFTGTSFAEAKQKVSDFRSSLVEKDEVAKTAKEAKAAAKAEKAAAREATPADAAAKPKGPKKRAKFMEAMGLVEEPVVILPESSQVLPLDEPPAAEEPGGPGEEGAETPYGHHGRRAV